MSNYDLDNYLDHLVERNKLKLNKLDDEDIEQLVIRIIKSRAPMYLPNFDRIDPNKEILTSFVKWIETNGSECGHETLSIMQEKLFNAFIPEIEYILEEREKKEEKHARESEEINSEERHLDYKSRI